MKQLSNRFLVIVTLAFGVAYPLLASATDPATDEEIQQLLSGNTLQGSGTEGVFSEYYAPDGTIRGEGYTAKWKVENGMGCMAYTGDEFECWTLVVIEGPAHVWYKNGKVDAAAMVISGNPNGY